jgi:hypothetical protein
MNGAVGQNEYCIIVIQDLYWQFFNDKGSYSLTVKVIYKKMSVMIFATDSNKCEAFSKAKMPAVSNNI